MSKERDEFVAVLVEAYLSLPKKQQTCNVLAVVTSAQALMRLGRESKTLAERQCNEPLTDEYVEKKRAKGFSNGGDPRGYTLKIHLPTERYNTWGGKEEGWGVAGS